MDVVVFALQKRFTHFLCYSFCFTKLPFIYSANIKTTPGELHVNMQIQKHLDTNSAGLSKQPTVHVQ